jgi:hypothetical protein
MERDVFHRVWRVGNLTIQLRPNLQPGSGPGKTAYARYEDGILWMYSDTPFEQKMRYITIARGLADAGAAATPVPVGVR